MCSSGESVDCAKVTDDRLGYYGTLIGNLKPNPPLLCIKVPPFLTLDKKRINAVQQFIKMDTDGLW